MDKTEFNETFKPHLSFHYCFDRPYQNHAYAGPNFVFGRAILDVILTLTIIIVNVILIIAIFFYRRKNRGTTRVSNSGTSMKFVQMLAVSDVLVALTLPLYLVPHYFCDINELMRGHPVLCMIKFSPQVFSALMSNMSLMSIAADRYIAVQYTLKYHVIMTHRLCHYIIAAQSIFSLMASSVLFFWNHWTPDTYCDLEDVVPMGYILTLGIICHSLILVTIIGVHVKMHQKASACASRRSIMELRVSKETSNSIKSAKVVVLVAGLYIFCWTPYSICLMARVSAPKSDPLTEFFFQLTFPLSFANSLFNPFVYAWKNSEIQSAVVWSLRRASS